HEASGAAIRLPRAAALGEAAGRPQPGVGAGPRSVPAVCASRRWFRRVRRCPDRTARRTSATGGPLRVVPRLRLVVRPAGLRYRVIHHVAPCGPAGRVRLGRVQLYGFWAGGFSYFATDANPDDACGCDFTQTLHDDLTWATEVGGGVRVALGRSVSSAALDLGIRALRNGEASYVTAGRVTQNSEETG